VAPAGVRRLQPGEHTQQRSLAGTVTADKTDTVAPLRLCAHVLKDIDGAE
jgi:hypothetical protein